MKRGRGEKGKERSFYLNELLSFPSSPPSLFILHSHLDHKILGSTLNMVYMMIMVYGPVV